LLGIGVRSIKDRNYGNVFLEGCLNFDTHPIIAAVETRFSGPVIPHPARTNDRDKDVAVVKSPFDIISKVNADWRRIIV